MWTASPITEPDNVLCLLTVDQVAEPDSWPLMF
jgi:hypothetical protein